MKGANRLYGLVNSPAGVCDLIILNATSDVAGTYTCQDASLGHPNSASAKLVVILSKLILSTRFALIQGSLPAILFYLDSYVSQKKQFFDRSANVEISWK